jgi:hypothetical protein
LELNSPTELGGEAMRSNQATVTWRRAAGATGLAALLLTYGCGGFQAQAASGPQASAAADAKMGPVLVSCEPNQRALVRPAATNGTAVSQVECVSVEQPVAGLQPVGYVQPASLVTSRPIALEPISSYPTSTVRPVRTVQADERPVRRVVRTRSVKKSAVIIGSSAGVGAGLGAAMGGKKGALVGALVGGGGAALWDQITRR